MPCVSMETHTFLESAGQGLYCKKRGQEKNEKLKKIQTNQ